MHKKILLEICYFDNMIKMLSYRKQVKALEYIRDNDTNRKEIKDLFGDDGIVAFEEAKALGAIYTSTMGISGRKNDVLTIIIKKHKNQYYEGLGSLVKWVLGILIGGGCLIGIHITINNISL